ncbi:MAG: hypothetical protein HY791_02510 [Deltaproteobacteria bacterium]|nr:hypothetical protein [Deltaproteobacteria bacterium]
MSELLQGPPFSARDERSLVRELDELTRLHLKGSVSYARIWPDYASRSPAQAAEELPWLHVGLFKHVTLATERADLTHQRTLRSSATSGLASRIRLDDRSSALQSESSVAILRDFVGEAKRPLLVLDGMKSLRLAGEVSARVAAALSLRPLADDLVFLLADAEDPRSMRWDALERAIEGSDELLVYGLSYLLWFGWARAAWPSRLAELLARKRVVFVHSGGWKKLESERVSARELEQVVLATAGPGSRVVDFYGLVEQVGVIYPLCEYGFRHVPRWAEVIVRDTYTRAPLYGAPGQLQLLNVLALGAPYHSVLTEDLGRIESGTCPCGRSGRRFELLGRLPKSELRGCGSV